MKKRARSGFTIVELIVVIAVIGILAGVMIPTFSHVIDKAHKAADRATLTELNIELATGEIDEEELKGLTLQTKGWRLLFYILEGRLVIVDKDGEVVESQNGTLNGTKTEGNKDFAELEEIEDIVPPKEWWQKIEETEILPPKDGEEYKELMSQSELNLVHIDSISDNYFEGNTAIERIKLSDNVIVGSNAFTGCTNLKEVTGKIKEVASKGFLKCTGLSKVELSSNAIVGKNAFDGCTNLREVTGKIKEVAYKGFYNCTQISEIDLSETTSIGQYAFSMCTNLSDVKLTKIKEITHNAFFGTSFKSLELCPCSVIGPEDESSIKPEITTEEMIISDGEINSDFCEFIRAVIDYNTKHTLKITVRNISLANAFGKLIPFEKIGENVELTIEDEGSYNALAKAAGNEGKAFNYKLVQKLWDQA